MDCLFDFPVSDTFARYEAYLLGRDIPPRPPEPPPLPARGAFNEYIRHSSRSHGIMPTMGLIWEPPAKPRQQPKRRDGLEV